jgi:hypothetical protein
VPNIQNPLFNQVRKLKTHNFKPYIGYELTDNVFTGMILGFIAVIGLYYAQSSFYNTEALGEYAIDFRIPFLKRALLGALLVFLIFNYLDKLYSMRGVLCSIIVCGIYLVIKMFFS